MSPERISVIIQQKIEAYDPSGNLDHTARLILALMSLRHSRTKLHVERVALMAEEVASDMGKDARQAFFSGLLHDIGKLVLPYHLFADQSITDDEFSEITSHAAAGHKVLEPFHLYTALVAGIHHRAQDRGYGLTLTDFPEDMPLSQVKKVLNIAVIVGVCDFIDAWQNRGDTLRDGRKKTDLDLRSLLLEKYPDDSQVVDLALVAADKVRTI
ncbi:HD domain-containing protein [Candidatus Parcubacteria bacterium]|jgi:hypothetical protein|nr:HD domain-containing protein [Candidatus Parcubacteria bacterium]